MEAAIITVYAMPEMRQPKIKRFILDKPFWVVMKRKDRQHRHFVLIVRNAELIEKYVSMGEWMS